MMPATTSPPSLLLFILTLRPLTKTCSQYAVQVALTPTSLLPSHSHLHRPLSLVLLWVLQSPRVLLEVELEAVMSNRAPLPLRLIQGDWRPGHATSRVLTVYKPSGLPCFAASQVSSASSGRQLFALRTRHSSANRSTAFAGAPQPHPDDSSDSVLGRVAASMLPGSHVYSPLPLISSLLYRDSNKVSSLPPASTTASCGSSRVASPALLNAMTARQRGIMLIARSQSDALLLRNAAHLGLIHRTYRVTSLLPPSVAAAVRKHQRRGRRRSSSDALAANPYTYQHLLRRQRREAGETAGITLRDERTGRRVDGVVHHPLLRGSFYDLQQDRLRLHGVISGTLRTKAPLAPSSTAQVEQRQRLGQLFLSQPTGTTATTGHHPWMEPSWCVGVSADLPRLQALAEATGGDDSPGRLRAAPLGKRFTLRFELVAVSPNDSNDVALWEAHTSDDVSADDIAAIFAAEGLPVLNDYVEDASLAAALTMVADRMRAAPPRLLAALPIGMQHAVRRASPEELVALPLQQIPLEEADRISLRALLSSNTDASPTLWGCKSEAVEDIQRLLSSSSFSHPVRRLLCHALASLDMSSPAEHVAYDKVMRLALGFGVECTALSFPDPASETNLQQLQQLWMIRQQQRTEGPLYQLDGAPGQHPMVSALSYVHRSTGTESIGAASIPQIRATPADGAAEMAACSYTQAVALLTAPSTSKTSSLPPSKIGCTASFMRGTHDGVEQGKSLLYDALQHVVVPASYSAACLHWLENCSLNNEDSAQAPSAVAPAVWPSAAELEGQSLSKREAARHSASGSAEGDPLVFVNGAAADFPPSSPHGSITFILRAEELGEVVCARCGRPGHHWQACTDASVQPLSALPSAVVVAPTTSSAGEGKEEKKIPAVPLDSLDAITHAEGLLISSDAAAALHASSLHRGGNGGDTIVSVPNMAATEQYKARHVLQSEARKPSMHRRAMRCVYCGGRHHVTSCPRLQDREDPLVTEAPSSLSAATADPQASTFCIKCGAYGHLYTSCRHTPRYLHPATHCSICLQPRRDGGHAVTRCPQRKTPPPGFLPNGEAATAEQQTRSTQRPRGPSTIRRRRSMLISDTFVDSKRR